MKMPIITYIELYKINLDFITPFKIALGEARRGEGIAVRIFTDMGISGLGEGSPYWFITGETQATSFEASKTISKLLLGKNPLAIEARLKDIDSYFVHNSTAKSAFDMALYDILAKQAGLPLYALLGGEMREIITDFTIGIDNPQAMAHKALEYVAQGACSLKVKLGTNRTDDVRRIQLIREAVGMELSIQLDANQGWDPVTAIATLQELAKYKIDFCEEPVAHWNNKALKRVHDLSPIPIMADESIFDHHDALRLAEMGACDYFNIKLAKSGGIHVGCKINAIGEAAGIACMVGGMFETRVGISAGAHLIAARTNIKFADLDTVHHYAEDPVIGGAVFNGCKVSLPDTPGHGADFDPAFLEKMEKVKID
jgi:L-alanine-DL-glutamate epimerase-like enolase superfamily enzyme